ncbi:MAG: hypothetical protein OHK0039_42170 [Bacteroidia bacterium]
MKELIVKEIEKIRAERRAAAPVVYLLLGLRLLSLGTNWLLSRWYLRQATSLGRIVFTQGRPRVINKGTLRIGNVVRIWSSVNQVRLSVGKGAVLEIGDNTRLNGPIISASERVIIGKNCRIAPQVYIMDSDFHDVNDRLSAGKGGAIVIGDGAWVATRAMVLKGVTIGKGAVVASGSVVTKDVPPYTVVGGVPARFIKKLPNPDEVAAPQVPVPDLEHQH